MPEPDHNRIIPYLGVGDPLKWQPMRRFSSIFSLTGVQGTHGNPLSVGCSSKTAIPQTSLYIQKRKMIRSQIGQMMPYKLNTVCSPFVALNDGDHTQILVIKFSQTPQGIQQGPRVASQRPRPPRHWMFHHLPCDHQALRCPHFGSLHLDSQIRTSGNATDGNGTITHPLPSLHFLFFFGLF